MATDEVDVVTARLRALHEDPACLLMDLRSRARLSLSGREHLARALDDLGAALRFLRVDDGGLYLSPSAEDLEAIAPGGFVRSRGRDASGPWRTILTAPARDLAARALLRLYVEHRKLSAR